MRQLSESRAQLPAHPGAGFRREMKGQRMQPRWIARTPAAMLIAVARASVSLPGQPAAAPAAGSIRSGYAVGAERCGQAPLAFPKIRIDMRPGYCAGLVASNEDGLVMPRSIVQIPGTRLFVVSDMGDWVAKLGRLLRLGPEAALGGGVVVVLDQP